MSSVNVVVKDVTIPTYTVHEPEQNPIFLEKRVFQGSSGKTYPLPFYNRISEKKIDQIWKAIYIENDFIEVVVLPQIGGRIFSAKDKSNGYDFIYRQDVIKPALVGLAGPWISGGIEFNWPQHHRPATYMPVSYEIENGEDGSVTVWLSDHDPLQHMKGMHGVCLYPDKSYFELKVRAYNRTENTQTFLWWANIATRVHEQYQSFFPIDVTMVADHAKRALSTFPLCSGKYYGVDYAARGRDGVPDNEIPAKFVPPHCRRDSNSGVQDYKPNDLSWYANIPVPTSYMCLGSEGDFCGGYDYKEQAGIVHVANHHISPGKKQWTWGNHDFGYAWDDNLSDSLEPYIELMAGVYTDNQPDFSYLMPGETKTWSQYFYPISEIGTAKYASKNFALNLVSYNNRIRIGIASTTKHDKVAVIVMHSENILYQGDIAVAPDKPWLYEFLVNEEIAENELKLIVRAGNNIEECLKLAVVNKLEEPETATEPSLPEDIISNDELYITGLHLQQYRHATRSAELYWKEALKRDNGDYRCNNALGLKCFWSGKFADAVTYYTTAIKRLTRRNPNPEDGEVFYNLGITYRITGNLKEAYDSLYKATWNMAWRAPAYHVLAEIDCVNKDWSQALEHLDYSLRYNTDNLRARNLKAMILTKVNRLQQAKNLIDETLQMDMLDIWARYLAGKDSLADSQARIDLAIDLQRAGFYEEAVEILVKTKPEKVSGTGPMLRYLAAWIEEKAGNFGAAEKLRNDANSYSKDYCFPSRLEEMLALESALYCNPGDGRAAYYLGNLYYNNLRHEEAVCLWEQAAKIEPENAIVWRNIGIGAYNIRHDTEYAKTAFKQALLNNPDDPRLYFEQDLLWRRLGVEPLQRIEVLEKYPELLLQSDELLIEYCTLLNLLGREKETEKILYSHKFQPWEGGEGKALELHVRLNLILGRTSLSAGNNEKACGYFEKALSSPSNLGEAKHLLANQSDIHYWLGKAYSNSGRTADAEKQWQIAAQARGDFQTMEVKEYSEMTYYTALSLRELGDNMSADNLLHSLKEYAEMLMSTKAKIDYFATSLPNLLLFDEDLDESQKRQACFLKAQALYGLNNSAEAKKLCGLILEQDPGNTLAHDFMSMMA